MPYAFLTRGVPCRPPAMGARCRCRARQLPGLGDCGNDKQDQSGERDYGPDEVAG